MSRYLNDDFRHFLVGQLRGWVVQDDAVPFGGLQNTNHQLPFLTVGARLSRLLSAADEPTLAVLVGDIAN